MQKTCTTRPYSRTIVLSCDTNACRIILQHCCTLPRIALWARLISLGGKIKLFCNDAHNIANLLMPEKASLSARIVLNYLIQYRLYWY